MNEAYLRVLRFKPYYLKRFLDSMTHNGFLLREHLDMLHIMSEAKVLVDKLAVHKPQKLEKWFDKDKNRVLHHPMNERRM